MKKLMCVVLVALVVVLSGCGAVRNTWKEITIENCGTLDIPREWTYTVEDGVMYMMDENDEPIMISYEKDREVNSNRYYTNFTFENMTSNSLENGAVYGTATVKYEDKTINARHMHLPTVQGGSETVNFIVWDTDLTEETLVNVAESFVALEQ